MNELEGAYEEHRFGFTSFQFPSDEPMEPSQEAIALTRHALSFITSVVANSRTGKSALMKLALVNSLFGNTGESSAEIAKRFGVSCRSVERCKAELLKEFLVRGKP
jgi:hypothetical protein